jgi:hypothetical protein
VRRVVFAVSGVVLLVVSLFVLDAMLLNDRQRRP